jgi:hypothetical protein
MSMKNKNDYKDALEVVRRVIHKWDPFELLAMGCPKDEFDSEIASVVALIPRIKSRNDATLMVSKVFSSTFSPEEFSPADCASVGAELFEALCQSGIIHLS